MSRSDRPQTRHAAATRAVPAEEAYLTQPVSSAGPVTVPAGLSVYLVDRIGDIVMVLERGGTLRYVNATVERVLGWTPEGLVGKLVTYFMHPEDTPGAVERFSRMLSRPGDAISVEVRFRHRDGSWKYFEAVGTNLLGTDIADGIVVTCRDISARRQAEAKVEGAERRFDRLVEYSKDSIAVIAADGTLLYNSPAELERLGYKEHENIGKSVMSLVHPEDVDGVRGILEGALLEPGCTRFMEFRVRQADGKWRWVEAVGRNLLHDPDVAGIVVNFRDISERRAAAEALRRKDEELQHAQKFEALGRLAGGSAHDFNNFLTVIKGTAQMLGRSLGTGHPQAGDVEEIRHAVDRAAELTGSLLAFSRGQILDPKVVQLNGVLKDAIRMIGPLVGGGITIRTSLGADAGWVRADPSQLHRVLLNLAANARDAMPSGGSLEIRSALEAEDAGHAPHWIGWAVVTFTDTGTGMDEGTVSHLFEPFFSTKEKGKGTGLGLATSYGIVAQSGGRIEVASTPGHGTTFRICLPAVAPPAEHAAPAAPERLQRARGGETILLVEDIANVRTITRLLLTGAGFRVLEASSAEDALRVAGEYPGAIDLLVTDIQMPGKDGLELARLLVLSRPALRVMFVSSVINREFALARSGQPNAVFLEKPFDDGALLDSVRKTLHGR